MDEREFWLTVRRGLLMVVRAIERRYGVDEPVAPGRR